jgi:solute:Na+ symporter, SSS family
MSGINLIDALVVAAYLGVVLYLGKRAASHSKSEEGYFLAGRKLGKLYQFFLNFGNATDANGAVSTATLVYQQGASGAWQAFQTVFMNPYYWFMNVWFRRVRLVTVAELFDERLSSRNLAKLYAFYQVLYIVFFIGWANLIGYNVTASLLPKPEASYTVEERQQVGQFREFRRLQGTDAAAMTPQERRDFEKLSDLYAAKRLHASISYVQPWQFYLGFTVIVGCYLFMGGMTGTARNEILQGVLIVTFSVLLIPFGFHALAGGGHSGVEVLRERVPREMLELLGAPGSGFVSFSALMAILLVSIIQINGIMGNMGVSGSAKNEYAARFGAVSGTYAKRLMIIMWSFVGLIGFAYFFGGNLLSDPDVVWGELSRQLLTKWPGLFGLMLAGLLAAMMSNIATNSMAASALFVRNVYNYLGDGQAKKERGVLVGRIAIMTVLVLGMIVALGMNDIVSFINLQLTVNVPWGAAIVLMFFWRRLSRAAVWWCVGLAAVLTILVPYGVQYVPTLSHRTALVQKTKPQAVTYTVGATAESLSAIATARETRVEQLARLNNLPVTAVVKPGTVVTIFAAPAPVSMYFLKVVRINPEDLNSPLTGTGRFNFEAWMLQKAGLVNLKYMTKPDLQAVQFFFDGGLPFIVLILVSLLTRAPEREKVNYFFGKMKTPVGATPELEAATMEETRRNPGRFDHTKLFPHSNWEWTKWDKTDTIGFVICLGVSCAIVGLFLFLLRACAGI